MASISTLAWKLSSKHARPVHLSKYMPKCLYRNQSTDTDTEPTYTSINDSFSDDEQAARIEEIRNVSRLPPNQYKQYHGQPPDLPYKDLHRRKMLYAQFGRISGEDPRLLWPSREKLLDQEEEEKEEGSPLSERLAQIEADKNAAEKAKIERRKMIAKNMAQMPKWIEEYKKKAAAVEREAKERAAKKEALLEEAREYFGYNIKANDPKFQQMVEEKAEKEKQEAKKRKKEEKLKKQEARLKEELASVKSTESKDS